MQQSDQAVGETPPIVGTALPLPAADGAFVINLTASTTPVALTQPAHPELRRFTFFVSRRREDGRERFRLHMGYFRSQEDAERLLDIVREIYPAAWAGIAPGQRLRNGRDAAPAAPANAPAPAARATTPAPAAQRPVAAASAAPRPPAARKPADAQAVVTSMTSVRAAIAALEAGPPAATAARLQTDNVPELKPAAPSLSDSQVLRVLESPTRAVAADGNVNGNARSELTNFAVQLMWSVQPIDMSQVPQLAIFNAYTLYGAEGNRDGRRWYGLRLGFFTDAVSAKQVAQYVRSEFAAVSVVPVTIRERERAAIAAAQAAPRPGPATTAAGSSGRFKLIDDKRADLAATGTHKVVAAQPGGKPADRNAAVARPTGKRVRQSSIAASKGAASKSRKDQLTLEETLEILGASELQIDDGRNELINDSGVRHLRLEASKRNGGSKLGRLINRLTDRLSND